MCRRCYVYKLLFKITMIMSSHQNPWRIVTSSRAILGWCLLSMWPGLMHSLINNEPQQDGSKNVSKYVGCFMLFGVILNGSWFCHCHCSIYGLQYMTCHMLHIIYICVKSILCCLMVFASLDLVVHFVFSLQKTIPTCYMNWLAENKHTYSFDS